jgi:G3E family GTPase
VIRAKGFFWLATRPDWVGELSQAGALVRHQGVGRWWAAVPEPNWPKDAELVKRVRVRWHKLWGDRRQELVFIGTGLDQAAITVELKACLADLGNGASKDLRRWAHLPDPFPRWGD